MIKGEFNILMNRVDEKHFYKTGEYSSWYPCISVDELFFIWTSMINLQKVQKEEAASSKMKPIVKKSQVKTMHQAI
jgi:hypothetical protein